MTDALGIWTLDKDAKHRLGAGVAKENPPSTELPFQSNPRRLKHIERKSFRHPDFPRASGKRTIFSHGLSERAFGKGRIE